MHNCFEFLILFLLLHIIHLFILLSLFGPHRLSSCPWVFLLKAIPIIVPTLTILIVVVIFIAHLIIVVSLMGTLSTISSVVVLCVAMIDIAIAIATAPIVPLPISVGVLLVRIATSAPTTAKLFIESNACIEASTAASPPSLVVVLLLGGRHRSSIIKVGILLLSEELPCSYLRIFWEEHFPHILFKFHVLGADLMATMGIPAHDPSLAIGVLDEVEAGLCFEGGLIFNIYRVDSLFESTGRRCIRHQANILWATHLLLLGWCPCLSGLMLGLAVTLVIVILTI